MRCSTLPLVIIVSSWLLTACADSNAGERANAQQDKPVPAGHVRVQFLGSNDAHAYREYRWRIAPGPDIATWTEQLSVSGQAAVEPVATPIADHEPFEVVYREQRLSGKQVIEDVKLLGGAATKQALIDANAELEQASAHRCSTEFAWANGIKGTTHRGIPAAVSQGAPAMKRSWISTTEGIDVPAGEPIVLTSTFSVKPGEQLFVQTRDGTPVMRFQGKLTPIQEVWEAGESPGWYFWVSFDTAKGNANTDPK